MEYADRTKTPFPDLQALKIGKTSYENRARKCLKRAEKETREGGYYRIRSARAYLEAARVYATEAGIDIAEELHRIESIIGPPIRPVHGREIA